MATRPYLYKVQTLQTSKAKSQEVGQFEDLLVNELPFDGVLLTVTNLVVLALVVFLAGWQIGLGLGVAMVAKVTVKSLRVRASGLEAPARNKTIVWNGCL